jgi:ribonuclease III
VDVHPGEVRSRGVAKDDHTAALQERIGVQFKNPDLLRQAMTHASWNNERGEAGQPGDDNERLEYLGDAVLELVSGEYLFTRFPDHDEGRLTQMRASLVNTISLSKLAEKLELGETLLLGKGAEKTGARQLPSLLANAFEAMIGAVFLDAGYDAAAKVFLDNIGDVADMTDENYKGKLQEAAQERYHETPHYRVTTAGGTGHRREYQAQAIVAGNTLAQGAGSTKQAAEQAAARAALERLHRMPAPKETPARRPNSGRARPKAAPPAPANPASGIVSGIRSVAKSLLGRGGPPRRPPSKGSQGRPRKPGRKGPPS